MLGPFDATMVVIGGIIGAGIFINPYLTAQRLDTPAQVLLVWVVGGAVALAGAFAYAELGQRMPRAGGQYVYLREAWHPLAGFLYGWALLLLIETGAIAAVAIVFAEYTLRFVGVPASPQPLAVATIVVLSAINYVGVKPGSRVLNVCVLLKAAALAALVLFAWLAPPATGWATLGRVDGDPSGLVAFGGALIPVLFAYGGWQSANYVAEEMRDPERHLPGALVAGTLAVVVIYVSVNVAYLRTLGLEGLAGTTTPAAATAAAYLGASGERFVAAAIAMSTFGFLNLSILAPTRVYYAMAADGAFAPALARLHPRFGTPAVAIVVQSSWSIALAITGNYADLLDTVVFADWIFFGSTVAGLFVLRRRLGPPAGVRTPGYPWLPAGFVLVAAVVVVSTIRAAPLRSAVGAGLLLLGIPVFLVFTRRSRRAVTASSSV
ncbi:MAG: amino acid permease [Vicinamibacterales bacterium]